MSFGVLAATIGGTNSMIARTPPEQRIENDLHPRSRSVTPDIVAYRYYSDDPLIYINGLMLNDTRCRCCP